MDSEHVPTEENHNPHHTPEPEEVVADAWQDDDMSNAKQNDGVSIADPTGFPEPPEFPFSSEHDAAVSSVPLPDLSLSDYQAAHQAQHETEHQEEPFVEATPATSETEPESKIPSSITEALESLQQEKDLLKAEIDQLKYEKQRILEAQIQELQSAIARVTQDSLGDMEQRKQELQASITVLQRKQERLQAEMKTSYAGASQDIAVRVQGFKDYLVGSLQDLVASAEKLNLVPQPKAEKVVEKPPVEKKEVEQPLLTEQAFGEQRQRIEQLLERYRNLPDYYGPAWKLRRTFEVSHAERVSTWFFKQAGRGAMRTMGTRLQNILVAAAAVSILRALYGDKVRVLILATSPERLGEWRRGFQDCLGINRDNFGPEKGVVLFEDPEPLALKGDRLVKDNLMPLVIIDEAEEFISVDLLRFPLLLGFGRDPEAKQSYSYSSRDFRDF